MPKRIPALTDSQIANAKPPKKSIGDGTIPRLRLTLNHKSRRHAWHLTFESPANGKTREVSLGIYPDVSIARARDLAQAMRSQVAEGVCPSEFRKTSRAISDQRSEALRATGSTALPESFEGVARAWLWKNWRPVGQRDGFVCRWGDGHADNFIKKLSRHVFPKIGALRIGRIEPANVVEIFDRLNGQGYRAVLKQVRSFLGQVFAHGRTLGYCERNIMRDMKEALVINGVKGKRASVTRPVDIAALLAALDTIKFPQVRGALLMHLYSANRGQNIRTMRWADIDLSARIWTIPGEETKCLQAMKEYRKANSLDEVMPLSRQAVEVLREMLAVAPRTRAGQLRSPYVFGHDAREVSIGQPICKTLLSKYLHRIGFGGRQTAHGFRAMWRTTGRERVRIEREVLEAQLMHATDEELGDAYSREEWLEERAKAVQDWADYLDTLRAPVAPVTPPAEVAEGAEVYELRRAA